MKKSIKVIGRPVEEAYVIKDIEIDQITLEKWSVECRSDIADAWGVVEEQATFPNNDYKSDNKTENNKTESKNDNKPDDKTLEIILKEKISNVKLMAKANVIETVAKMGGKIIKDIKVERAKKGKKNYLGGVIFFKEV